MSECTQKKFLNDRELSEMTGIARQTLSNWRHRGKGPEYVKLERLVLYPLDSIENFFSDRMVKPHNTGM